MNAHTYELGIVLAHAAQDSRVTKIFVALGGSASTDAGVGALMALGYRFLDIDGKEIGKGGGELLRLASIDSSNAIKPPAQGVVALVDVQSPLLGSNGAAATYAPQKGATAEQIAELEKGLSHLLSVVGRADSAGSGAAGGTSFGLRAMWGATFESGAEAIGLSTVPNSVDLSMDTVLPTQHTLTEHQARPSATTSTEDMDQDDSSGASEQPLGPTMTPAPGPAPAQLQQSPMTPMPQTQLEKTPAPILVPDSPVHGDLPAVVERLENTARDMAPAPSQSIGARLRARHIMKFLAGQPIKVKQARARSSTNKKTKPSSAPAPLT
jgi:hypothetical protein